jgi:hypothetical protein
MTELEEQTLLKIDIAAHLIDVEALPHIASASVILQKADFDVW